MLRTKIITGEEYEERAAEERELRERDRLAFFVFAAAFFLLPLFVIPGGFGITSGKSILLVLAALVSLFVWIVGRLKDGVVVLPRSSILYALSGFLAAVFFSTLFSDAFRVSLDGLIFDQHTFASVLTLAVLLVLSSMLFLSRTRVVTFFTLLIGSFFIVALFHLARLVLGADVLTLGVLNTPTASLVGSWNDLALFAGFIAVVSIFALDLLEFGGRERYILASAFVLALFFTILVDFEAVWYLLGIISLAVLVLKLSSRTLAGGDPAASGGFPMFALVALVASVLFIISGGALSGALNDLFGIFHLEARPSWTATLEVLKSVWSEHPVLGSGPARFSETWLLYKPAGINSTIFWNTDFRAGVSLIPTWMVMTGLLGALALIGFLAAIAYQGMRTLLTRVDQVSHYLLFAVFASLFYFWGAAFFYTPGVVPLALAFVFTGVFVALLSSEGRMAVHIFERDRGERPAFGLSVGLILLLVLTVSAGYAFFQKTIALAYFNAGTREFARGNIDAAEVRMARAAGLSPSDVYLRGLASVNIAQVNRVIQTANPQATESQARFQQELAQAIQSLERAVDYDETDYQNWLLRGNLYASLVPLGVEGAGAVAESNYAQARELNPESPQIALLRGRLALAQGNEEKGRAFINEALSMKNNYTDALFLLARLEVQNGNAEAAIRRLEEAAVLSPNDSGLFFQLGLLHYQNEGYRRAIPAFERAVALIPSYSNARYFLGLSYYETERSGEAVRQFERVKELNPNNEEVEQILANLKAGREPFANIVPPAPPPEERSEPPLDENIPEGGEFEGDDLSDKESQNDGESATTTTTPKEE